METANDYDYFFKKYLISTLKLLKLSYLCRVHTKISHSGIIESIAEGCVKVRILQTSACAACKIAGHCNASESKEKIVEVFTDRFAGYSIGQEVVVCASRDVANKALLLGFGVPFLVLVGVLVLVLRVTGDEGVAALSGILALIPYYFVLYLFRSRIREQLSFYIE